jgi:DUF1365 family protein
MDHRYELRASEPGEALVVQIDSRGGEDGEDDMAFDATLSLRRRELSRATLTRMLVRYPAPSLQVIGRIYLHALRLRLKGATWHPHPKRRRGFGHIAGKGSTAQGKSGPGNFISR